jgi:hypothetical protein
MAGRKQTTKNRPQRPVGGKSYNSELPPQVTLDPGDAFQGRFIRMRQIEIIDKQTKQPKQVMVYDFISSVDYGPDIAEGSRCAILGRSGLDTIFANMEAEIGEESMHNREMYIERGDNTPLPGGRTLGNYDVILPD